MAFANASGVDLTASASRRTTTAPTGSSDGGDEDGGSAATSQTISVANVLQRLSSSRSAPPRGRHAIEVAASATDPAGANDTLSYSWEVFKDGVAFANGSGTDLASFSFTPDDNGSYQSS